MTLETAAQTIRDLIADEQHRGAVRGTEDLAKRLHQRVIIREQLQTIEQQLAQLKEQIKTLPKLPPTKTIQWAQAILHLPNLVYLEIDTTGLNEDAEIVRACVMGRQGEILLDSYARPVRPLTAQIMQITGINNEVLARQGKPLVELLTELRETLQGRYVISYNLEFDLGKLHEATQRVKQADITIIGEDLMKRAMEYFGLQAYPKLETLCKLVEHPLVEQPGQTILDRVKGQAELLRGMAEVITEPGRRVRIDGDGEDEHPF